MNLAENLKKNVLWLLGRGRGCPEEEQRKMFQIRAERDSVCMGDDCNAPNARYLDYEAGERLSEFLDTVARYVPLMKETVWSVACEGRTIAYLVFDGNGDCRQELAVPDGRASELAGKSIYCRYYHNGTLLDYGVRPPVERYPECGTLLEKVKAHER